jgi:hypothetical protein
LTLGTFAGILIAIILGTLTIGGIAYGILSKKLSVDAGIAVFLIIIAITGFGLTSSIPTMTGAAQQDAVISLFALNGISIAFLACYTFYTTYYSYNTISVQDNAQYIMVLIPATMILSIVSLSATVMHKLKPVHCG